MRFWALLTLACAALSCGGQRISIDDEGGAANDAGGADAASDAPVESDAQPDADPCAALLARIEAGRDVLTRCCAACNSVQCNAIVEDVCCPLSYTSQGANPEVAKTFAGLVREYEQRCKFVCPGVQCKSQPSMTCDPRTTRCAVL